MVEGWGLSAQASGLRIWGMMVLGFGFRLRVVVKKRRKKKEV